MSESCSTCRFCRDIDFKGLACVRNPPAANIEPGNEGGEGGYRYKLDDTVRAVWPPVRQSDWCGEWKAKT